MSELLSTKYFNDASCVAYYRLEAGALTTDSKGSFTLTNNNTVGETAGKFGGAADFGTVNTNKYLSIANDLGIDGGAMTMMGWFKFPTEIATGTWGIMSHGGSTTDVEENIFYEYNGGTIRMTWMRIRNNIAIPSGSYTVSLADGNWHHIAYAYDATTVKGYLDGVERASFAATGNGDLVTADQFWIGRSYDPAGTSHYGSGYRDDVAVFTRGLTGTEVLSIYNAFGKKYASYSQAVNRASIY